MYELENKLITLNSDFGTKKNGEYLSDMVFNFTGLLKQDASILSSNICAINAQFAVSWYIINESNNVLYYTLDETTFQSITITPANYNANTLFTAIVVGMNTAGIGGFTFSLFQPTGIVSIANPTYLFRFVPFSPNHPSTLSRVLGITKGFIDYKLTFDFYIGSVFSFSYLTTYTIALPVQNYTLTTLRDALNIVFTSSSIPLNALVNGSQIRVLPSIVNRGVGMVYSPTDLSFYFGVNTTQSADRLQDYNIDANLLNNTIDSLGLTQTADTPLNLLGVKKISVKSSLLGISSYTSESGGKSITLTTIPADKAPFQMISYENKSDLNKQTLGIDIIDNIDIQITDERDNFINFNNVGWTITLVLESIRRKKENIGTFKELLS
jgi:hypothetical protein